MQFKSRNASYPENYTYVVFRGDDGLVNAVNKKSTGESIPWKDLSNSLTQEMIAWGAINGYPELSPAPAGYDYAPAFY